MSEEVKERAASRATTRQVGGGQRAKGAGRITRRDWEIAAWVGRLPVAEARQVAERFEMGRSQAYRRLQVLCERGELRSVRMLHGAPAAYVARGRKVPLATYDHALCLASLVTERELALGVDPLGRTQAGEQLTFTERDLRAARRRGEALPLDLADRLLPDLAEAADGGPRAFEIELTPKAAERWRAVLSAYALADPPYERVTYIVRTPQIGAAVTRAAEAIGAQALVGLRELPAEWVRVGPLDRR